MNVQQASRRTRSWSRVLSLLVIPGMVVSAMGFFLRTSTASSRPGLVFEAIFEHGMTPTGGYFFQEGNRTPHVTRIAGQSALRVDLNHYDDANPSRTELVPRGMDSKYFDNGGFDAKIGQTYWYGMKIYIPADFKSDGVPEIITQFHDYPDAGENWKNPAVDLTLEPWSDGTQHYMVSVRSDTKQITPAGGGDKRAGKYTSVKRYDLGPVSASAGQWTEWVWKIKWGYDSRGDLELYRNGKLVLDLPNQGNCFNDQLGPYMKLGLYKWDWAS
ncbi:MAG TPA: polysaccharide lyase, partial [Azospirillum sp.]|nr:polysaccharide lyase [Azospirillum sp.]